MPHQDKANRPCGFIDVEEKEKSGKFIRRYLRLDISNGILEWFADTPSNLQHNYRACGAVDLNFITQVDIPLKVKFKAKFCFVVNTPMRKYYFQANNEHDMREWVETLNNASKIVVSDDEQEDTNGDNPLFSPKSHEDFSYKTEIVAGVVIQKKVVYADDNTPIIVKTTDSRSQSLVTASPNLSINNESEYSKCEKQKVIKEGWAVKQGHVRKNWKRRYFILTTSGFSYYKSDHVKEAIRVVTLPEILAAKADNTSLSEHKDNLFFVATTERIYYIQADSPQDMKEWVTAFNNTVQSSRSLKHRTKGSEPGDNMRDVGSTDNVARRRKLEVSVSLAPSSQRNSAQVLLTKNSHAFSTSHSPVAYYRLSTADGYNTMTPNKLRSSRKRNGVRRLSQGHSRVVSSSEESGLNSSMDSLTSNLAGTKISASSTMKSKKRFSKEFAQSHSVSNSKNRMSDSQSISDRSFLIDAKERHSFPSTKTTSIQEIGEFVHPLSASASISPSQKKRASYSNVFSSQSFSCSNPNVRSSKTFLLDPKVDQRAAVKPSSVKKKRNTGILFSLNNVLNKKAEKMNKPNKKRP